MLHKLITEKEYNNIIDHISLLTDMPEGNMTDAERVELSRLVTIAVEYEAEHFLI